MLWSEITSLRPHPLPRLTLFQVLLPLFSLNFSSFPSHHVSGDDQLRNARWHELFPAQPLPFDARRIREDYVRRVAGLEDEDPRLGILIQEYDRMAGQPNGPLLSPFPP